LADFLLEQFDGHDLITNLGLEILNEIISPLGELRWRDGEFTIERIEGLASQDSQDDISLATDRPASLIDAEGTRRFGRASPSLRHGCVIQRKTRFFMSDIIFKSPKLVCQYIVH
jgi:hypothetical protein